MKLNNDLIRELLLYIEENGNGEKGLYNISINGYTEEEIQYHLIILEEGLYIVALKISGMGKHSIEIVPKRLTEKGHRYIENIRDKNIFKAIKREIELKGIKDFSLDMIVKYSDKFIKDKLEI